MKKPFYTFTPFVLEIPDGGDMFPVRSKHFFTVVRLGLSENNEPSILPLEGGYTDTADATKGHLAAMALSSNAEIILHDKALFPPTHTLKLNNRHAGNYFCLVEKHE